jgi:2-oxoglutarate dehydrogenase E2 component (dihydrolipoamide succinyltransferase)
MFSLSYDHRIVDGADADRFMSDLKRDLEQFPEGLL